MDSTIHRVSCMARAVATPTIRPATAMAIQAITTRATTHRQPVATTIHHTDTTTTKMRTMDTTADTTTAPTEHIPTVTLQATTIKIANESSVCHIIKDTHNNTTPMDTSIDCEKNIVKSFSNNTQTHTHNSPPPKNRSSKKSSFFCCQQINQCINGYPLPLGKRKIKKKYEQNPTPPTELDVNDIEH